MTRPAMTMTFSRKGDAIEIKITGSFGLRYAACQTWQEARSIIRHYVRTAGCLAVIVFPRSTGERCYQRRTA